MGEPASTRARVVVRVARPQGRLLRLSPTVTDVQRRLGEEYQLDIAAYFAPELIRRASSPFRFPFGADGRVDDLREFLVFEVGAREAQDLVERLRQRPDISLAYVEAGPRAWRQADTGPPAGIAQGYLDPAPHGIDARWAWDNVPADRVRFADMEQGWHLQHPELAGCAPTVLGDGQAMRRHGTAVLGVVIAPRDGTGVTGAAYGAPTVLISQWNGGRFRTATAIMEAVGEVHSGGLLQRGDVLLLEAQTACTCTGRDGHEDAPVEIEAAVFAAIRAAVDAGLVVVEAGGNGGFDMDLCRGQARARAFRRDDRATDSGAIWVGAAKAAHPHGRHPVSNFGARFDCYAWGEHIATCQMPTANNPSDYRDDFDGTSGAAAIVAGAAVLLQSWAKAHGGVLSGEEVRRLLSDEAWNTWSEAPEADKIGCMPDLRRIITELAARRQTSARRLGQSGVSGAFARAWRGGRPEHRLDR